MEGVTARKVTIEQIEVCLTREIPLLIDPRRNHKYTGTENPDRCCYGQNTLGTHCRQASLVIALGPGFTAGKDAHAVIETQRSHDLGRVLWKGEALANTGVPGEVAGYSEERLVKAPADGTWKPVIEIGDLVAAGDLVARVDRAEVKARLKGSRDYSFRA